MTSPCSSVVGTLSPATRCDTKTASAHPPLRFQVALADETTLESRTEPVITGLSLHIGSLMNKIGARNRVEIAIWAYETRRVRP